ncbi:MAG: hypothetical protein HQK91_07250 [Nitrospirae bacterium]|nr:hypothetical protein [Nitrospirota bacterium]MBF0541231.1 hypothetical protein [Nitrospirota bacterium]
MKKQQQNNDTLFTDDFPIVLSQLELDKAIQEFSQYDPYYVLSGCHEDNRKEIFDTLWRVFKDYADSHFLKQYKTQFHQRTWEMYVGYLLLQNNFKIKPLDKGPDFIVDDRAYIECVTCSHGDTANPYSVPHMPVSTIDDVRVYDVPVNEMILRITQALSEKYQKYQ